MREQDSESAGEEEKKGWGRGREPMRVGVDGESRERVWEGGTDGEGEREKG